MDILIWRSKPLSYFDAIQIHIDFMTDLWQLMYSDQAPLKPDSIKTNDHALPCRSKHLTGKPGHIHLFILTDFSSILWAHSLSLRVISKHFKPSFSIMFSTFYWKAPAVAYHVVILKRLHLCNQVITLKIKNLNQLIPSINYFFFKQKTLKSKGRRYTFYPAKSPYLFPPAHNSVDSSCSDSNHHSNHN